MTWLIRLYPRPFRQRYGAELADLIAAQPFSVRTTVDLIAGAIDAWIHPQLAVQAKADAEGEKTMMARLMRFECAGYGAEITAADTKKSLAISFLGTIVMLFAWWWIRRNFGVNSYVVALAGNSFLVPYFFSLRYTTLKGRSSGVQWAVIIGITVMVALVSLLAAWIGGR